MGVDYYQELFLLFQEAKTNSSCRLTGKSTHFPSVASRTIRRAFWLLSIGLHLWALNACPISPSASAPDGLADLNSVHRRRSLGGFADDPQFAPCHDCSLAQTAGESKPCEFQTHHYPVVQVSMPNASDASCLLVTALRHLVKTALSWTPAGRTCRRALRHEFFACG